MKPIRTLRRLALGGAAAHAWAVFFLKPDPRQLLDPGWHLEVPVRLAGRGLARLLPAVYERYGERGVKRLQYVFYQVGLDRAPVMREFLRIDPDDARSLGRVLDFEDGLVGVRGVWVEENKGRATKEERYCPIARELEACPEVCTKLMMAMEAGTFAVLNPDVEAPEPSELLSTGGSCCLGTIELPYLGRREARKRSPQATPGAFPPALEAPGLRWRLAALGAVSLLKALLRLAVTDIDDIDMHWYERLRYPPR